MSKEDHNRSRLDLGAYTRRDRTEENIPSSMYESESEFKRSSRRHVDTSFDREARIFNAMAIIAGVCAVAGGVAGFAIGRESKADFACYTSNPDMRRFYPGKTALEAAQLVPGVRIANIDLRQIPMSINLGDEPKPAGDIDYQVSEGLYGPDNCAKVD